MATRSAGRGRSEADAELGHAEAAVLRADDWREQHRRWDRLHYLRVAIIVASFVLVLVATTTI